MSYTSRLRDAFHKTNSKKISSQNTKSKNYDINDKTKLNQPYEEVLKEERTISKKNNNSTTICQSPVLLTYNNNIHTARLERFDTQTTIANPSQPHNINTKVLSNQLINPHQPRIKLKLQHGQHINNKKHLSDSNSKLIKTTIISPEESRSMSAVYRSHSKPESSVNKTFSHKQHLQSQHGYKLEDRRSSEILKKYINTNAKIDPYYNSTNRAKTKSTTKPIDGASDKQLVYYSLPRKPQITSQTNEKHHGTSKRISSDILYIDTGDSKVNKVSHIHKPSNLTNNTTSNVNDESLVNFNQTLARAATNSPPIKRRTSFIHSSHPTSNTRFATKSIIDEIYTLKNRRDNYEKYKKVANEILKENLALKFGKNYPLNNLVQHHSSSSSLLSSSSATDRQRSISPIPVDDIPLHIPNQHSNFNLPLQLKGLLHTQNAEKINKNVIEVEECTDIFEGTVTSVENHLECANIVHLSDEEDGSKNSDDYDLDQEQSSSASDSDGSIEQIKKRFVPLHEIERMTDDFVLENNMMELPDYQYSQSFRIENMSLGTKMEVFIHQESLQRAKNALNILPNQGILSIKSQSTTQKKRKKAVFDSHILLLDACLEPDFELVKELVPKISNISKSNVDGITPLHNAVCSAEYKLVLYLIESGADVNASDNDGWTPLHCASCCNNRQLTKLLVENGASLYAVTLSDNEIPSQKCNKTNQEDTQCEEYLFWEQENLGVINNGIVYSLFEYIPQRNDELTLLANQILKIINTNPSGETGWFFAENISEVVSPPKRGFVPAAYVSCYPIRNLKHH